MAATSPGQKMHQRRKPPKSTLSMKNHTFEPFTQRLARLKIDPVHTIQTRVPTEDASDLSQSYFRASLDEWTELNLSRSFTSFVKQVEPLCENLPQILHHADEIFETLIQAIQKRDELALEPLLSLAAHFAHDLGRGFEKYFEEAVSTIAKVAASHENAEVIEWCFGSLAWMFKYLSRLLVKDLVPVLEVMRPYLSAKKEYIARFAAESLAFLLRKAAVAYGKQKKPLEVALHHLLQQRESTETLGFADYGPLSLLVESCLGIDGGLHSCAPNLASCAIQIALEEDSDAALSMVCFFLTGVIHLTNASGFAPVLEITLDFAETAANSQVEHEVRVTRKLLYTIVGTRKGTRVALWKRLLQTVLALTEKSRNVADPGDLRQSLALSGLCLQYAPMSELLPISTALIQHSIMGLPEQRFYSFCIFVADMGRERFQTLLLPHLQQHILSHVQQDEVELTYVLETLQRSGNIQGEREGPGFIKSSHQWETSIISRLEARDQPDIPLQLLAGLSRLPKNIHFPTDATHRDQILDIFTEMTVTALDSQLVEFDLRKRLCCGWILEANIMIRTSNDLESLFERLLAGPDHCFRLAPFLRVCSQVVPRLTSNLKSSHFDRIVNILVHNLFGQTPAVRDASLVLLQSLASKNDNEWMQETFDVLLQLIQLEYTPSNTREISMLLRRLPQRQTTAPPGVSEKIVPFFILGILPYYHDRGRKNLCKTLGQLIQDSALQDVVFDILSTWLRYPTTMIPKVTQPSEDRRMLSQFECSNLVLVDQVAEHAFSSVENATENLLLLAEDEHRIETSKVPERARSLALQVLFELPSLAEKRSRLLTPVFLAVHFQRADTTSVDASDSSTSSHTLSPEIGERDWSLADRKAFVSLLGLFQNPKVIFRSDEVHSKLLDLLCNGNTDIRRLAFIALLRWKDQILLKHETILNQIIDDKFTNANIGIILNAEAEDNPVPDNERSTVLPVLLRLLFGSLINRSGIHGTQEVRRKSILRMLFKMKHEEVNSFLAISLGKLSGIELPISPLASEDASQQPAIALDQQYGMLNMITAMMEALGEQFTPFCSAVIEPVLYCTVSATVPSRDDTAVQSSLSKRIMKTGLKCLSLLFELCPEAAWDKYTPVISSKLIRPKLETFVVDNSQGVSALLQLISTWCKHEKLASLFTELDDQLPKSTWRLVSSPNTKDDVKLFILENVLAPIVKLCDSPETNSSILMKHITREVEDILGCVTGILQSTPRKNLLASSTSLLLQMASLPASSKSKRELTVALLNLLHQSKQRLSPLTKSNILSTIRSLVRSQDDVLDQTLSDQLEQMVSSLFSYFKDSNSRLILCDLLQVIANKDGDLQASATLCDDLNAVSATRLNEPDFDRRLVAFQMLANFAVSEAQLRFWQPILYNLLYFIQDEDFSIRSNAVSALKRFVREAACHESGMIQMVLRDTLLPALSRTVLHDSEVIRADAIALYGEVIQALASDSRFDDMRVLLVGNDEEASFFSNILHVQLHRRLRAISRLTSEAEKGTLSPANIADFFIPVLQKFLKDDSGNESMQATRGQTLLAMRALLLGVEWRRFKAIFKRYKAELTGEERKQSSALKVLGHAADALHDAWVQQQGIGDETSEMSSLAKSLPSEMDLVKEVQSQLLPNLAEFIHHKDEAEMSLRLPAATVAVKLASVLSSAEAEQVSAPIVLDVANILRSKALESRDAARRCLAEITTILGAPSVGFVLRELRNALKRGSQLHVLSFTVHAILVKLSDNMKEGSLDYCLSNLVSVVMDDTFGNVGQEKDNQDYISSMKEVKSKKSFDTIEMLGRVASIDHLRLLIEPLTSLLTGSLSMKQSRQVDELLRRIGLGLARNPNVGTRRFLTFSYQTAQSFYQQKAKVASERPKTHEEQSRERLLIDKPPDVNRRPVSPLLYKIARFAIDLVRSAIQRHRDLLTPENVHGFLSIIGDALLEAQEDVKISALRLLSAIIKLRMPELDQNAPIYVAEAVKIVKSATNTNEEAAQAALKLVSAVLRERRTVEVRDADIVSILQRITPDLEEPDRQGVTFNFIRAVMTRQYQLPEVYDVVDKIAVMMVTNQARGARDVARGVYVHFLAEYPQTAARWTKQQKFMIKNLEYDYPEGRESVMEAINSLLHKMTGDITQQLVSSFFLPIALRMANDDHKGCQDLAGALLGQLFLRADQVNKQAILASLISWMEQEDNEMLSKLSLKAFDILLELLPEQVEAQTSLVIKRVEKIFADAIDDSREDDHGIVLQALDVLTKLTRTRPALVLSPLSKSLWELVRTLFMSGSKSVRNKTAELITLFFHSCKPSNLRDLPVTNIHGLSWDAETLRELLRGGMRNIRTADNEGSVHEVVALMSMLGQIVDMNGLEIPVKNNSSVIEHTEDALNEADSETSEDDFGNDATSMIPATQYLIDQSTIRLRREIPKITTAALKPKLATLELLKTFIPHLSSSKLTSNSTKALLAPLIHLTSSSTEAPRSADTSFASTFQAIISLAHEVLEILHDKLGDSEYVRMITEANKLIRERRDERRKKRVLEKVAEPEREAKRRKGKEERKKVRRKEIKNMHRGRRRGW